MRTMNTPERKVAIVTGCSSGIGLLTAIELARTGFYVIATMRNLGKRARLDAAATHASVTSHIDVRRLDVTEFTTHTDFLARIKSEFGGVHCVVNNAGFALGGFSEDVTLAELREQFETNFFGAVSIAKAAFEIMREQGSGHVIQVSSIAGRHAHPCLSSYSASKFALEGWSEAARLEMKPLGINVVLVEPGSFETEVWETNARVAAKSFDKNSPNHLRSLKFRDYLRAKVVKRDAAIVARTIAQIARDPNPKLRYVLGKDAKYFRVISHLVPWRRYERAVAKAIGL